MINIHQYRKNGGIWCFSIVNDFLNFTRSRGLPRILRISLLRGKQYQNHLMHLKKAKILTIIKNNAL